MLDTIMNELDGSFPAVSPLISATRLIAAMALGALVGIEREHRGKPAGLRTQILVSIAACLFILISQQLSGVTFADEPALRVDPLRLIEAVTAGVAFLAAGLIFTSHGEVHNVTTGAALWLSGAIGMACGAGQIPLAAMSTALVLAVLFLIAKIEEVAGK